jgi:hypothetical protein
MGELWIYWQWTHILEWSYARQYFWVRLANNVGGKSFKKFKTQMDTSLNKAQHKQKLLCRKYLALVGLCMSLRNLPKFIQLWSISKSRFSKINTNSDITPPNNLDNVTFKFFACMRFCVYQGITTLISSVYQNRGHAQVVATNLKQRMMYNLTMSCGSSFYWLDKHLTKGSITY